MPAARNNQALIYIYRPESHYLSARTAHFEVDGRRVGELKNNGYTALYLKPGSHTISQRWTKLPLDSGDLSRSYELKVTLPPGSTRYIRLVATAQGVGYIVWRLEDEVKPSQALKKCRYTPADS